MDKNLTVEIFVPTLDSAGKVGKIGTGYPIGRDLLITARHVLFPEDRDSDYSIQIRWRHPGLKEGDKGWTDIDKIVWERDGEVDVALIKAPIPKNVDGWGFLTPSRPDDKMEWVSEGFAAAGGKDDGVRRKVAMSGRTCSAGDTDSQFELTNRAPVKEEQQWKGASGSPVFVESRIIGIIITCPPNFDAARLRATPCWKLLEIDSFRKASGYDDQVKLRAQYRDKVVHLLKQSPDAMRTLASELDLEISVSTRKNGPNHHALCLADRLLELKIEKLIRTCRSAQRSLQNVDKQHDAKLLSKITRMLLPAAYDFGAIRAIRSNVMDVTQGFVSLPVSISTVAEIIMAKADVRPARYRDDSRFPEGAYKLPAAPEGGWGEDDDDFQKSWDSHLINLLAGADVGPMVRHWDRYMIRKFAGDEEPGRDRRHEQQVKFAANELKHRSINENKTYYFVFSLPSEEPGRTQTAHLITDLKHRYPAIVFLSLDSDFDLELKERDMFREVSDIIAVENKETP